MERTKAEGLKVLVLGKVQQEVVLREAVVQETRARQLIREIEEKRMGKGEDEVWERVLEELRSERKVWGSIERALS